MPNLRCRDYILASRLCATCWTHRHQLIRRRWAGSHADAEGVGRPAVRANAPMPAADQGSSVQVVLVGLEVRKSVRIVLLLIQVPGALMVLYLDILSAAALWWRQQTSVAAPRTRFAVLVPAHDEQVLLPRLMESLAALDYPSNLFDVHVVADNCTDRTAEVAARSGAIVHERQDTTQMGKGFALRWLLQRIRQAEKTYDAFVVIDADSVVAPNFLDTMNRHLVQGATVIQSYYGVYNREESPAAALRYTALVLFNDLRPRGRDVLGLSAGLRGNGMCFGSDVLERFGWEAFTLAEDVEFHFQLVEAGIKVKYAADTSVLGEMPTTLREAQTQNVRWERGRIQMLRRFGPRLLRQGMRQRDPAMVDAVAEQLVPPLSVLSAAGALCLLGATILRVPGPRRLAAAVVAGQAAYVLTGLALSRSPLRFYLALLRAPTYIAWKVWIYARAAARPRDSTWIRTSRPLRGGGRPPP